MKKLFVSFLVIVALVFSFIGTALAIDIPAVPVPIAPANGAVLETASPLQVTLVWLPVTGATSYNVVFALSSDFVTPIFSAMTTASQQTTPFLNYGVVYYWKVQASNLAGTSAWSAVQTFTFTPRTPILLSPSNWTVFSLNSSISLNWQPVSYPSWFAYLIEIAYDPGFSVPVMVSNISLGNSFLFTPPGIGYYYWRVRTFQGSPTIFSPYSEVRIFRVTYPSLTIPIMISPHYNELITANEVTLQWSGVPYASVYQVQTRGTNFDQIVFSNSYPMFLTSGQNYAWRVRAGNTYEWGPWSTWTPFQCILIPGMVNLTYPTNDTPFKAIGATLRWQEVVQATSYKVSLTDDLTGQTWVFNSTVASLFVETQFNHWYSWRVAATNAAGQGPWSTIWHFSVLDVVSPVVSITEVPEWTGQKSLTISGKATDAESGIDKITVNGVPILFGADGTFAYTLSLSEGVNFVTVVAYDQVGNMTSKQVMTKMDTIPPEVIITRPLGIKSTVIDDIAVEGKIIDAGGIKNLVINNNSVTVDRNGYFSYPTTLNYGPNQVYVSATDMAGNQSKVTLTIVKVESTITFAFQVGNPRMTTTQIGLDGQPHLVTEEIDPGRNTAPLLRNDRVFIPVRKFVEVLGGDVFWDNATQKVTIKIPGSNPNYPSGKIIQMELWVGKSVARITDYYGVIHYTDIEKGNKQVVPFINNGRSYFPLRFIVENFGLTSDHVQWYEELQMVKISYPIVP